MSTTAHNGVTERIAITGLGIVSAAGRGLDATAEALRSGASGLGPLELFPSTRCGHFPVGEVSGLAPEPGLPRTVALGRLALTDALHQAGLAGAGLAQTAVGPEELSLCLGTCVGGMPETENAVAAILEDKAADDRVWGAHECGATTAFLAREFDVRGPCLTLSSACSSSAQALAAGVDLLAAGEARAVVAGGVDVLCRLTLHGFASLLAMDPEGCRPFDRARGGMSLGEGAAFCVLEREPDASARGARPLAFLSGFANTCDAHHPTAPEPEGRGAAEAMELALERSGWDPARVDYVNAHGTGTRDNDLAEGRALARVFDGRVPAFSSTKRCFGHTLAAAGAIEAVVSALCLERGFLPGNPGFSDMDPEIGLEPLRRSVDARPRRILSSSFGFGGNNTVLCFEGGPQS
jgi:3-oxoacyl-(acyl-carrier-protein) synthase